MTTLIENALYSTHHYLATLRAMKIGEKYTECNSTGTRKLTLVGVSPATRGVTCADSLFNPIEFTYNANRRSWVSNADDSAHLEVRLHTLSHFSDSRDTLCTQIPVRNNYLQHNGRVGIPRLPQTNYAPDPFPVYDAPKQPIGGGASGAG